MKSREKHLLKGGKFGKRHTTYIDAAYPLLKAAKDSVEVSKIVLGPINPTRNGRMDIKFDRTTTGLRVILRGPRAVQEFYVTTSDPEFTQATLTESVLE